MEKIYFYLNDRFQAFFDPQKKGPVKFLLIGFFCLSGLMVGAVKGWAIGGAGGIMVFAGLGFLLGWLMGMVVNLFFKNLMPYLLIILLITGYIGALYLFSLLWGLGLSG